MVLGRPFLGKDVRDGIFLKEIFRRELRQIINSLNTPGDGLVIIMLLLSSESLDSISRGQSSNSSSLREGKLFGRHLFEIGTIFK